MDDVFDDDLKGFLQGILASALPDAQLQSMVDAARSHLTNFILDANLSPPEHVLSHYGISLSEEEMSVALEASEERTSRIRPILPIVDSYAAVVACSIAELVTYDSTDFPEELSDQMFRFLSDVLHASAVCAVVGTLTQLERRGDVLYLWEWGDVDEGWEDEQ